MGGISQSVGKGSCAALVVHLSTSCRVNVWRPSLLFWDPDTPVQGTYFLTLEISRLGALMGLFPVS